MVVAQHPIIKEPTQSGDRLWLCDTGCPVDLVNKRTAVSIAPTIQIEQAEHSVELETANGVITTDRVLLMQILSLEENVEPYVVAHSPDVLSIGRRCQELGYEFHWPAHSSTPYFVSPDGRDVIKLETIDFVPHLRDSHNIIRHSVG